MRSSVAHRSISTTTPWRSAPATPRRLAVASVAASSSSSSSRSSSSSQPPPLPRHARVRFSLNFRCDFGQELAVVGSHCGWDPCAATPLSWNEGDWWSGEVELPLPQQQRGAGLFDGGRGGDAGETTSSPSPSASSSSSASSASSLPVDIEYKYIVRQGNHAAAWQPDSNFALRLGPIEEREREEGGDGGGPSSSFSSSSREGQEQQTGSLESCFRLLFPSRVVVGDSWDGAVHDVTPVEVVEVAVLGSRPPDPPPEEELSPAAAAEELQAALSAAVSALDGKRVSPASREALEADARVAEAAARASAAAAAVSRRRKTTTSEKGFLGE